MELRKLNLQRLIPKSIACRIKTLSVYCRRYNAVIAGGFSTYLLGYKRNFQDIDVYLLDQNADIHVKDNIQEIHKAITQNPTLTGRIWPKALHANPDDKQLEYNKEYWYNKKILDVYKLALSDSSIDLDIIGTKYKKPEEILEDYDFINSMSMLTFNENTGQTEILFHPDLPSAWMKGLMVLNKPGRISRLEKYAFSDDLKITVDDFNKYLMADSDKYRDCLWMAGRLLENSTIIGDPSALRDLNERINLALSMESMVDAI